MARLAARTRAARTRVARTSVARTSVARTGAVGRQPLRVAQERGESGCKHQQLSA